jgi:hypothetical protein
MDAGYNDWGGGGVVDGTGSDRVHCREDFGISDVEPSGFTKRMLTIYNNLVTKPKHYKRVT